MTEPVTDIHRHLALHFGHLFRCSSKHLSPLLSSLGGLEDTYFKTPRTRRARKAEEIISATILNLDPTLRDRRLRKNIKLFFQNCLGRRSPLCSCYRNFSGQQELKTAEKAPKAAIKLKARYFRHQDHPSAATFNILTEL